MKTLHINVDTTKRLLLMTSAVMLLGPLALIGQDNEEEEVIDLDPFTVSTSNDQGFRADAANTGSIIAVPLKSIPFNTSVVTRNLMNDLNIDNVSDIVEYVPGLSRDDDSFVADEIEGRTQSFRARGFVSPPLYNGFQIGDRIVGPDNVERVEISRGPNSVLYGQSPGGGIVNFIPKLPMFEPHAEASLRVGTKSYLKGAVDLGGPIEGIGKGMAFRFGASYQERKRDEYFYSAEVNTYYGALTYQITDNTTLSVQGERLEFDKTPSRTAAFVKSIPTPADLKPHDTNGDGTKDGVDLNSDGVPDPTIRVRDEFNLIRNDRNFTYSGPYGNNESVTENGTIYLTHRFNESFTARIGGLYSAQDFDSIRFINIWGICCGPSDDGPFSKWVDEDTTKGFKADLLHEMYIGKFKVNSLVGYEWHNEKGKGWETWTEDEYVITIPLGTDPREADWPKPPPFSEFTVLRRLVESELQWENYRFTQFITEQDDAYTLMWGVAYGEGDNKIWDLRGLADAVAGGQSEEDYRDDIVALSEGDDTTYTFGGTARVLKRDSGKLNEIRLFANYSTSFLIQSGNAQDPASFEGFATLAELEAYADSLTPNPISPQTGSGYEFGARFTMLDRKLYATLTYFDQTREDIARSFVVRRGQALDQDPTDVTSVAVFQANGGEEQSDGFELEVFYKPSENLQFIFTAEKNDGVVVANPQLPAEEGFGLVRDPEETLSFWGKYDFNEGSSLNGLAVGLGGSYQSSTRLRPDIRDSYRTSSSFAVFELLVEYGFELGGTDHMIRFNIENLLDREYTKEANFLSEPRLYRIGYQINW